MKTFYLKIPLLLVVIIVASCNFASYTPDCKGAGGGSVKLEVYALRNGINMHNYTTHRDTVFVKYNATTNPGISTSNYNVYFVGKPGDDLIQVTGLQCGDYYVWRTAWDSVTNIVHYGGKWVGFGETTGDKDVEVPMN